MFWLGCLGLLLIFSYGIFSKNRLDKHGILLNAHTSEWAHLSTMNTSLKYELYFHGRKILGNNSFKKISGLHDFEDRNFPVMYDTLLGTSQLLIEPADFQEFNIPYPDSLNWVLQYLK